MLIPATSTDIETEKYTNRKSQISSQKATYQVKT